MNNRSFLNFSEVNFLGNKNSFLSTEKRLVKNNKHMARIRILNVERVKL